MSKWHDGRVLIAVSARMRSERCPGKALAPLAGKPLLVHLLERLCSIGGTSAVVLATSENAENDVLVEASEALGVRAFRGDENDVLGRYVELARTFDVEHLVRVTGDNPLTDLPLIESLVAHHLDSDGDYTYVRETRFSWESSLRSSRDALSKRAIGMVKTATDPSSSPYI